MTAIRWRWSRRDLLFMIETLMPERDDKEHVVDIVQDDEPFVEAMLDNDRLFQRLMAEEVGLRRLEELAEEAKAYAQEEGGESSPKGDENNEES